MTRPDPARPTLPSPAVPRTRESSVKKIRIQDRIVFGLSVLLTSVTMLLPARSATAQLGCPPPPANPQFWVQCGVCRGDLNSDGLLNGLDLMIFELYQDQFPQNYCADFNDDGVVNLFDEQILRCLITSSNGACVAECGPQAPRTCFQAALPGTPNPGGCNDAFCCQRVCETDPACCSTIWDNFCVGFANNICRYEGPDVEPDAGNCLCEHEWDLAPADSLVARNTPGCSDPVCSELVCVKDPSCCQVTWDTACTEIAAEFCQSPCTNLVLSRRVCLQDPACCQGTLIDGDLVGNWDLACVELARDVIINDPALGIKNYPSNGLLCDPGPPTKKDPAPLITQLAAVQVVLCQINPGQYCPPGGTASFDADLRECITRIQQNYPECEALFNAGRWNEGCAQVASQLCRWPYPLSTGLGNCLLPNPDGGGCSNGYCNQLVTNLDPSCQTSWDVDCARLAAAQCVLVPAEVLGQTDIQAKGSTSVGIDFPGIGCGSDTAGACCYQNFTPYCEDGECCQLVCSYDDYCCDVRWDEFCAQLATAGCSTISSECTCGFKLIEFGPLNRSCFEERSLNAQYATGCQDATCCNAVCYLDTYCCEVRWDAQCADTALQFCSPLDDLFPGCGDPFAGSCYIPDKSPYCDDTACCQNVCEIDPSCCTQSWDVNCVDLAEVNCVQCGDIFSGSCLSPNGLPGCADENCCESVCEIDRFCCEVSWDSACVGLARGLDECKLTVTCGSEGGRNCFLPNYLPGCTDVDGSGTCCTRICTEYDPFCCEARWDDICVIQAIDYCDPPLPGGTRENCFVPHGTPGCNISECALQVCSVQGLEYCCTNRWDNECVKAAENLCIGIYQCPGPGDCKTPHANPLCDDPSCCNVVCNYDPSCCTLEWDAECAALALQNCVASNATSEFNCPCKGSCFEPREENDPRPGCEDISCCIAVCQIDEACCTINWDNSCAVLAQTFCGAPLECGSSIAGSCVETHDTPFCDDPACCASICKIDPFCCSDRWDSFCVVYAIDRCQRACGIQTAGSCYFPHATPGCSDSECCQAVCAVDPICCSTVWDATCATLALGVPKKIPGLCNAPSCGDFAAGDPCKPNLSPSSNDKRCCNAVCAIDPICCDTTWDLECVRLARTVPTCPCGADWDCGDPCAGDCCIPNFTPKCNDEDCCENVCAQDSFCCDNEWDLTCATMANVLCNDPGEACPAPQCGDEDAGQCCFANGTPACNDQPCCDRICNQDPICCEVGWDDICSSLARDPLNGCDICSPDNEECGSNTTGPCDEVHSGPFCDEQKVCECVCLIEPFCCVGNWDENCVFIATEICP